MDQARTTVKASELREGMTILEITRFDSKYSCLDSETLKILKDKFDGAKAVVLRDSGKKSLPMDGLKLFDEVTTITDLPDGSKFSKVASGMGAALEGEGFFEFSVTGAATGADQPAAPEQPAPAAPAIATAPKASNDPAHKTRMEEAKAILEKVDVALQNHQESSNRIEEMMDQGRAGKINTKGAAEAVENILKEGSASTMKAVAGLRVSDQTYAHCVDVSVILKDSYADMLTDSGKQATEEIGRATLLSGFLHDIGKIKVPKEILDSTARFAPDSEEMKIIRSHPVHSRKILSEMGMSKSVVNVAAFHHVKKDTSLPSSYPEASYDEVMPVTRLASIVDVYQALIGSRSYKPNWVPGKAVELLMKLRGTEFDERALGHFLRSNGIYPVGSLVRLSTGDLAFVIKNERESLERPVIAIVENSQGELVGHHDLIDLMVQPELDIAEVVDHYKHYDKTEDHALNIFKSIVVN